MAHEIAAELGRQSGDDELREVYRRFNRHFGLGGYRQLPRRRFAEGLAFLTAWREEVAATPVETFRRNVSSISIEHQAETVQGETVQGETVQGETVQGETVQEETVQEETVQEETVQEETVQRTVSTLPDREIHEKTGIEFIRIPAGPFLYGDEKREMELPEYWIGRYPLTNAQYKRFVDATSRKPPGHWKGAEPPPDKLDHPVVHISWYDAQAYCDWAGMALPTEEEWEKAARGDDGRVYPWGNEPPTAEHGNFNRKIGGTTPVGRYSPRGDSPYGCADMAGNVWEWTATGNKVWRVLRGGSWFNGQDVARAAFRRSTLPYDQFGVIGCRLVHQPPSQAH